jgi:hypothetical protein
VFELIALILEALFSWPVLPTDWPVEHRRLVHRIYIGLIFSIFILGMMKLALA